jgi:hypothetical protein
VTARSKVEMAKVFQLRKVHLSKLSLDCRRVCTKLFHLKLLNSAGARSIHGLPFPHKLTSIKRLRVSSLRPRLPKTFPPFSFSAGKLKTISENSLMFHDRFNAHNANGPSTISAV